MIAPHLRDIVLRCSIAHNPTHLAPGWEELKDFSKETWRKVADYLVKYGWKPPPEIKYVPLGRITLGDLIKH